MNSSCIWKQAIPPLLDLRLHWNDKLEVVDNAFQLTKGQAEESNGTLFIHEPSNVIECLNSLINETARTHLIDLRKSNSYENLADFKRQFKCLNNLLSDLRHLFKDQFEPLYESSLQLFNEIVEYKQSLKKPLDRPIKHITYNERTELSSIKAFHPKRVPINETVKAAQAALTLAEPKIDESLECCVTPVFFCLSACSILKIFTWNPLELLYKGQVTTRAPIKWAVDDYIDSNKHMQAVQKYSTQLLNCPLITEEIAMGFAKLAPYATTLDLKNAMYRDPNLELKASRPQIELKTLGLLLEAASASKICNTVHISKELLEWEDAHEFLTRHNFYPSDEYLNSFTYNRKILF